MKFLRYFLLVSLVLAAAAPSHAALRFLWPNDNGIVRESVRVAIDAGSVPVNAYVTFFLNDTFMAAAGVPTEISGGRKAYVWTWDTREPINLGDRNQAPQRPEDGTYTIRAVAVQSGAATPTSSGSGISGALDTGSITVRLANRVTSVPADTPLTLQYRYSLAQRQKYDVTLRLTVAEIGGAPIQSKQEVQTVRYTGIASVEDLRGTAMALMRYRPAETSISRFGRNLGEFAGFEQGSIYQLVDNRGRVHDQDLFSTVGIARSPAYTIDFRTPLPRGQVRSGDQWSGTLAVSMPAMGEAAKAPATLTLEGLEWAGGRECARIGTEFSGSMNFSLEGMGQGLSMAPIQGGMGQQPAQFTATGTDWFAFRTGELVRREVTVDVDAFLESATVQALNQGLGLGTGEATTPSASTPYGRNRPEYAGPGDEEMALAEDYQRSVEGIGRMLSGGAPSISSPAAQGTQVKLRVRLSARLVN